MSTRERMSAATPPTGLDRLHASQSCNHRDPHRTDSFHFMRLPARLDSYQAAVEMKRKIYDTAATRAAGGDDHRRDWNRRVVRRSPYNGRRPLLLSATRTERARESSLAFATADPRRSLATSIFVPTPTELKSCATSDERIRMQP